MFKFIFTIFCIVIFFNGCGYKTDPIYVEEKKEIIKK